MSLQWALVAGFLYLEIGFIVLLLLPIISPRTWHRFFKSKFLQSLEGQANLYFTGFLIILILLFVDSIREMNKHSTARDHEIEHGHLDSELQHSMKLFRAQRNFYIAGFALFLYLVIRRLVLLITAHAQLKAECEASMKQAKGATEAAQRLLDDSSKGGDKPSAPKEPKPDKDKQAEEISKLRLELSETREQMIKIRLDRDSIRKQSENLSTEYDRLLKEHEKLQHQIEVDGRKDR